MVPVVIFAKLSSSLFIDKLGVINAFKIIILSSLMASLGFWRFNTILWVFYILNAMFVLNYSYLIVMVNSICSLLYGISVGKRLFPIIYCVWTVSAFLVFGLDWALFVNLGLEYSTFIIVGADCVMVMLLSLK